MAATKGNLADFFGVESGQVEGDVRIRAPRDEAEDRRSHRKEIVTLVAKTSVVLAALLLTYALSALFLHHDRPEQAEKVVATVIGIGRKTSEKD